MTKWKAWAQQHVGLILGLIGLILLGLYLLGWLVWEISPKVVIV